MSMEGDAGAGGEFGGGLGGISSEFAGTGGAVAGDTGVGGIGADPSSGSGSAGAIAGGLAGDQGSSVSSGNDVGGMLGGLGVIGGMPALEAAMQAQSGQETASYGGQTTAGVVGGINDSGGYGGGAAAPGAGVSASGMVAADFGALAALASSISDNGITGVSGNNVSGVAGFGNGTGTSAIASDFTGFGGFAPGPSNVGGGVVNGVGAFGDPTGGANVNDVDIGSLGNFAGIAGSGFPGVGGAVAQNGPGSSTSLGGYDPALGIVTGVAGFGNIGPANSGQAALSSPSGTLSMADLAGDVAAANAIAMGSTAGVPAETSGVQNAGAPGGFSGLQGDFGQFAEVPGGSVTSGSALAASVDAALQSAFNPPSGGQGGVSTASFGGSPSVATGTPSAPSAGTPAAGVTTGPGPAPAAPAPAPAAPAPAPAAPATPPAADVAIPALSPPAADVAATPASLPGADFAPGHANDASHGGVSIADALGVGSLFGGGLSFGGNSAVNQGFAGFSGGGSPELTPASYMSSQVASTMGLTPSDQQTQNLDPWSWMVAQFSPFRNKFNSPWMFT